MNLRSNLIVLGFMFALNSQAQPQASLSVEIINKIDAAAREALASVGAPSASIAIVKDKRIIYVQAYGDARLDPKMPAQPKMRYEIGSVSKQFTATALLMLAEEGKLSLDDPVSRFLPGLTRAKEIKIRQLLSHTSGYQDYWPQDYLPPNMLNTTTASAILDQWAKKPLDFEPGIQYQYSNTGYVAAGLIIEKASGMKLLEFLNKRIFSPLGMNSVVDLDQRKPTDSDAVGYMRYALGPLRVAPKEGKGWLFAAGELAMTAEDLAKWNVAMLEQRLLKPASYLQMQSEVLLRNGLGIKYGLGIGVSKKEGRRVLEHGGEVMGFTAQNIVFVDDGVAISVLANQDASEVTSKIAENIETILFAATGSQPAEERARQILAGLQKGTINRTQLTLNANSYFSEQALKDFASSLSPLGRAKEIRQTTSSKRGGMLFRLMKVSFADKKVVILERDMPDGKIEEFQILPSE